MIPSTAATTALGRLVHTPDFVAFAKWLEREEDDATTALRITSNTVLVHQLQGQSQCLVDILRAIRSAKPVLG